MKTESLPFLSVDWGSAILFCTIWLGFASLSGRSELPAAEESLLQRFLREAPPAWQAYAKLLEGNQGSYRNSQTSSLGNARWEFGNNLKANKDCALVLRTRREQTTNENDYREEVYGINPRYAFRVSRRSAEAKWTVALIVDLQKEKLPDDMDFSFAQRRWGFMPPVIHVERDSLESIVKNPTFAVQRCRPVKVGDEELVEIAFTLSHDAAKAANKPVIDEGVLVLDPARYWCLRKFEGRARLGDYLGQLRLEVSDFHDLPGPVPVPRKEVKEEDWQIGSIRNKKTSVSEYDLSKPDRLPEDSEFTLTAFGLPEPPGLEWKQPTPWWLWAAGIGVVCLVIAGVFRWLRTRAASARI